MLVQKHDLSKNNNICDNQQLLISKTKIKLIKTTCVYIIKTMLNTLLNMFCMKQKSFNEIYK